MFGEPIIATDGRQVCGYARDLRAVDIESGFGSNRSLVVS